MDLREVEPFFGSWYLDDFLGEGSFGKVYRIKHEDSTRKYFSALKWISIPKDEGELNQLRFEGWDESSIANYYSSLVDEISKEIQMMYKLRGNSNIVSYEDHLIKPKRHQVGYDIFIKMELLTSVKDYFHTNHCSPEDITNLGLDICNALAMCKKLNIIHRDIKPDNVNN